jgi:hypothetical protein
VKPRNLIQGLLLSFALGAILSVGSDSAITHQVQQLALTKAQATATSAMQKVGSTLGQWLEQGLDAALKKSVPEPAVAVAEVSQNSDATAPRIRPAPAAKALAEVSGNSKKLKPTSGQPKTPSRRKAATTRTPKSNF